MVPQVQVAEQKRRNVEDGGVWFPGKLGLDVSILEKRDNRMPFLLLFCLQTLGKSQMITLFWSQ